MVRPQQRVIIYSGGIKKKNTNNEDQINFRIKHNMTKTRYVVCNHCDNKVTVIAANGNMRRHRLSRNVDLIYCFEKTDYRELTDSK